MSNVKVSGKKKSRVRQSIKYWTKARRAKAKPMPLKVTSAELMRMDKPEIGVTRIVQPVLPGSVSKMLAETNEVTDMTQFPFSYVGKLFMREGDNDYVGSAWVIGEQAIFTAAHCLFDDNGTFYDDVVFFPQYRDGSSLGGFGITQMAVDPRYYISSNNQNLDFDLGIALLDRPISHLTGIAGYTINPTSQIAIGELVTGIGYPAGSPFDGSKMFKSKGRIVRDSAPGTTEERFFGAENEMTGGCSGGPWVDSSNIAIGINSFVFVGENPPIMHSPYFGQGFVDLLEWAEENGGIGNGSGPIDDGADDDDGSNDEIKERLQMIVEQLAEIVDGMD